jgi:hypothetical protein
MEWAEFSKEEKMKLKADFYKTRFVDEIIRMRESEEKKLSALFSFQIHLSNDPSKEKCSEISELIILACSAGMLSFDETSAHYHSLKNWRAVLSENQANTPILILACIEIRKIIADEIAEFYEILGKL